MRTIIETRNVPAEEVTITTYGCEECDFTADDKDDVTQHYAKEHSCRATADVSGHTLRWFDTEADASAWLNNDDWYRIHTLDWYGPGWYATETGTQPCRRGCCNDPCIRLFPADKFVQEAIVEARTIMRRIIPLRAFLRSRTAANE